MMPFLNNCFKIQIKTLRIKNINFFHISYNSVTLPTSFQSVTGLPKILLTLLMSSLLPTSAGGTAHTITLHFTVVLIVSIFGVICNILEQLLR